MKCELRGYFGKWIKVKGSYQWERGRESCRDVGWKGREEESGGNVNCNFSEREIPLLLF